MRLFVAAAAAIFFVIPSRATPVFTNFKSGPFLGCAVDGANSNEGVATACAAAFTPLADYLMTDVQVEVGGGAEAADPDFDFFLYSDNGGLPGSSLGEIGSGVDVASLPSFGIVTVNSPALSLSSGTEYWLVIAPHDDNTSVAWASGGNSTPPTALDISWPGSDWVVQEVSSQFEID
jgi:hypothetical protein